MNAPQTIEDTFRADNEHLRESIKALIELSDAGSLSPHGLGGHARILLASCYHRLAKTQEKSKITPTITPEQLDELDKRHNTYREAKGLSKAASQLRLEEYMHLCLPRLIAAARENAELHEDMESFGRDWDQITKALGAHGVESCPLTGKDTNEDIHNRAMERIRDLIAQGAEAGDLRSQLDEAKGLLEVLISNEFFCAVANEETEEGSWAYNAEQKARAFLAQTTTKEDAQ